MSKKVKRSQSLRTRLLKRNFGIQYRDTFPHLYNNHVEMQERKKAAKSSAEAIEIARRKLSRISASTSENTKEENEENATDDPKESENQAEGFSRVFNYRTILGIFVRKFRFFGDQ
jgi:hypothetical protein